MAKGERSRRSLLSSLWDRTSGDDGGPRDYVLFAIEGADAGLSFPIDRPQMQIGRSLPGRGREGEIRLTDRSVSSRHALLSYDDGRVSIEHLPSATNPTLVNGRRVKRSKQLREGDRIVLGLAVLELRALPRPALEPPLPRVPGSPPASSDDGEPVDARAALVVREGPPELIGKRFPLTQRRTALGRDEDCDIVLDVGAVSRRHAALLWQGDQLILVHESRVNPTHVNDMPIADRRRVFDGDEITLSERVTLELVLEAHREEPARAAPPAPSRADDAEATRLTSPPVPPAADPTDAEATRISLVSPPPGRPEPRGTPPPAAAADAGETFIEAPSDPKPGDDAETRIMQAPDAPSFAPSFEEGDATRIAEPPESPKPGDAAETRIMQAPDAPSFAPSFEEGDATRIAEPPESPKPGDAAETRIMQAPDAPAFAPSFEEGDATRIAEPPESPKPGDAAETRIMQAPDAPSFAPSFEEGDATRIAEPPESPKPGDAGETRIMQAPDAPSFAPSFEEGDATRIAEPPAADASRDSGATRVVEPPEPGDEARTMIRPAPRLPAPPDDGPRTRIIDLDAVLRAESPPPDASEQATVIRQGPRVEPEQPGSRPERRDLDSEKTLIRPVPGAKKSPAGDAPAAETVIIQTPDAEDDD